MTSRNKKRLGIAIGAAAIIGGLVYFGRRQRHLAGLGLFKPKYRLVTKRFAPAPLVGSFEAGGMRTEHRRSAEMPIEERVASIQDLVWKGVQDGRMRKLGLALTQHCPERDEQCEIKAIYDHMKSRGTDGLRNYRYAYDIAPVKMGRNGPVEGVDLFQSARRTTEMRAGDCLPLSTLVLRDDYELVPLIELEAGDRIMADGAWTMVQDRWLTGEKSLLTFQLSNGCVLRCTPEHRIFRNVEGRIEEIRASEARVGDDLITPEQIPVAGVLGDEWPVITAGLSSEELAWLLGVFIADGWTDGKSKRTGEPTPYRAGISGADGKPKEEQKRRVQALMERIGVDTRWHHKYLSINDSSIARFFAQFGSGAPNKHASLRHVAEADVRALLEGLAADADRRNGVYGTTSPKLALELRVLHRMLGQSVHLKRVDDHGGFGDHPIYRITPRAVDNDRRDMRFARIRSISDGGIEMCMDLTTEHGKFWLPESDVLVHNCDDAAIKISTLLAVNGITPRLRVTAATRNADDEHIYAIAGVPRSAPTKWIALDATLPGDDNLGVELPRGRTTDFPA